MTRPKRVLMLSYFYPPIGGGGVQRSAKFAKYLPEFNWEPYVISTTESVGGEGLDDTLLADIRPGTKVWRVPTPRVFPLRDAYQRLPSLEEHALYGNRLARAALKSALFPLSLVESPPADPFFWWSLRIIPLALRLVAQHKIDLIYTTSSPWSSTVAGHVLKRLTGRPWVADFRDPWTFNMAFFFYRTGWRWKLDKALESSALAHADRVITAVPMDHMLRWRSISPSKRRVIYNGFDKDDFLGFDANRPQRNLDNGDALSVVHMGTVYPGRQSVFFDLLTCLPPPTGDIRPLRLTFIGDLGYAQRMCSNRVMPGVELCFLPRMPHSQAIRALHSADVLLLTADDWTAPGKVFEYLASGTPVFAVTPKGSPAAGIIRATRCGCVADPQDGAQVLSMLRLLREDFQGFKARFYHPDSRAISQYERRSLTSQLADVFEEVTPST